MEKYRKVKNKWNNKEGYISLNYFINHGLGFLLEFTEDEWVPLVPKGFEFTK